MNSTQILQAANAIDDTAFAQSWTDPEGQAAFERIVADDRTEKGAAHRPPRLRRRLAMGVAVAAAAGAAFAVLGLPGTPNHGGTSGAWAVTTNADGSVTINITDFRDPEGLQKRLRAAGVPADVIMPMPCDANPAVRAVLVPASEHLDVWMDLATFNPPYDYRNVMVGRAEQQPQTDSLTVTIRPDQVPPQDRVLVGFPADHQGKTLGIQVRQAGVGWHC